MKNKAKHKTLMALGCMLPVIIWIGVKYCFNIEDRYLPSPKSVLIVFGKLQPNILLHALISLSRLLIGFVFGILLGIFTGLYLHKSKIAYQLIYPTIQSIRAIPPYASIPFFLLWFGFSEIGKFVILICGITFNLAVATYQTLLTIETKYDIFFKSIGKESRQFTWPFTLPYVIERILPTLRFSLSTAIGLVVVAEMLGAQMGLGYVIQTSRSTYSMDVIILAAFLFGIVNVIVDKLLIVLWKTIVFWRKKGD
ncbi:MAG: ABC transporter permease [Bacteroidales bacterium]|nr:ABC transporter permease [Bacteroidales bacterium]